jgi:N,N'-diacetylchitobiose non-reducing end deacetylase
MNIREVLGLPDLLSVNKIVAVQPHPDDNEVAAGGTLATLSARGCEITYVTVTDGRAGAFGGVADPAHLSATRQAEARAAGDVIGAKDYISFGFPDGGQYEVDDVVEKLVDVFRAVRPDLVMTVDPWMPYEAHPDHLKTGTAVARASLFANNAVLHPIKSDAVAEIPQVAFYASSYPNTFVDVTASWEQKLTAILAHKSQFDNAEWPMYKGYFEYAAVESFRIWKKDPTATGFAEAFKVLSTRQLHMFPAAVFV